MFSNVQVVTGNAYVEELIIGHPHVLDSFSRSSNTQYIIFYSSLLVDFLQNGTQQSVKDLVTTLNGADVPGKEVVGASSSQQVSSLSSQCAPNNPTRALGTALGSSCC